MTEKKYQSLNQNLVHFKVNRKGVAIDFTFNNFEVLNRLRLDNCILKVTSLKYLVNTNCCSLEAMLIWIFTCTIENLLYL